MMQSHLFIAHVRASTSGETMRANCHPFTYGKWSFAHNGQIGEFAQIQRELESLLSDQLYLARRGTTDSELLFLMLLQEGLEECPKTACQSVIKILQRKRETQSISTPLRLTFVFSDGCKLFGVRYASDKYSPTLYHSRRLDNGGISLASEPLDGNIENWVKIKPSTMIEIDSGNVLTQDL